MKQSSKSVLTLRNLPAPVNRAIRKRAKDKKVSLNKAVIGLLEEASGAAGREKHLYHDLDYLAGSWGGNEAEAFEESLAEQRGFDEEAWQ